MQVSILRQPLYGTVFWTGDRFVYTPYTGLSGTNDYFIYTETVNGSVKTYTQYVNSLNNPPVANNVSLTADAFNVNIIPITLLASDQTTNLGSLTITSVSGNVYGSVNTDGNNIYYTSKGYNAVEHLTYSVSDVQYTSTAVLTLSVVNGAVVNTQNIGASDVKDAYDKSLRIKSEGAKWDSTITVTETYSANWNSLDSPRYNSAASVVENGYQSWNDVYSHKGELDSFYVFMTVNSGTWNTYTSIASANYDLIKPYTDSYNSAYNTLQTYKTIWYTDIIRYNSLNSDLRSLSAKLVDSYTVVNSNSAIKWDSTDLNSLTSSYLSNWYSLSTLSGDKLDNAGTQYTILYSNLTGTSANNDSLYTTVNTNSSSWSVTDLVSISANKFYKWDSTVDVINTNKIYWDAAYSSTTGLSAVFDVYIPKFDNVSNVVTGNKNNWNSTNIISGVSAAYTTGLSSIDFVARDLDIHGNLYSSGTIYVSGDIKKYDTTYVTADEFDIYNQSTNNALTVNKIGGAGLIASFNIENSRVLFVENNNTVGINSLTGNSNQLTVSGSISASGYIHPYLKDTITTYSNNSANYENVYTALNSSSATTISALTSRKPDYDNLVNYLNLSSSAIDGLLTNDYLIYDTFYTKVGSQSANNDVVNNYISLSGAYIDIDPEFVKNKPKYDILYSSYQLLTS